MDANATRFEPDIDIPLPPGVSVRACITIYIEGNMNASRIKRDEFAPFIKFAAVSRFLQAPPTATARF